LAGLTEVIMLGQTTPYSKELIVERYVIPLAPMWGGLVKEVHASPNTPLHKGDPIFSMDSANRVFWYKNEVFLTTLITSIL
jgi:multidrug resistance efflux pump